MYKYARFTSLGGWFDVTCMVKSRYKNGYISLQWSTVLSIFNIRKMLIETVETVIRRKGDKEETLPPARYLYICTQPRQRQLQSNPQAKHVHWFRFQKPLTP